MATLTSQEREQMKMADEVVFSGKQTQSFVKELFKGRFDASRVLPYPEPSAEVVRETDAYVSRFAKVLDEHLDADWNDRHATVPAHTMKAMAETGFFGMTIPKKYGGLGMTQYAYCRAIDELAKRCAGSSVMAGAHQSIGLRAILMFGNEKQKECLAPLARGEALAAFALTEPEVGSDASNVQTRAVHDPVKRVYCINGQKRWITNGGIAKVLTLLAKTEIDTPEGKKDKVTAFLVTPDMPGFRVVDPALEKLGIRASMTAKLEFKDMEVPEENVLGELGGGLKIGLKVLNYGRLSFGSACSACAAECVRLTTEHVQKRVQFGQPIGKFGLVQDKLARMAAIAYAMKATSFMVVNAFDQGEEDIMLESALLKVFVSDELWAIVNDAIQVHGGKAFFCDQPFERWMRDARLNSIGEGANEVMRVFIALTGMRDVGLELQRAARNPAKMIGILGRTYLQTPTISVRSLHLQEEARWLAKTTARLGREVVKLLGRYREGVMHEQLKLDRIATTVIALYSATSVVSKLDTELARSSSEQVKLDLKMGKLYCRIARQRVNDSLGRLWSDEAKDQATIELARSLTGL